MSQVISSFLPLPHELKNRGTKRKILKVLKIALENFTWSGKEIPHVGFAPPPNKEIEHRLIAQGDHRPFTIDGVLPFPPKPCNK